MNPNQTFISNDTFSKLPFGPLKQNNPGFTLTGGPPSQALAPGNYYDNSVLNQRAL
jgi:hypothetical protein